MKEPILLNLIIHLYREPALSRSERNRAWNECFAPLIGALHHNPEVKASLVLAGELVEDFQELHPEAIDWIRDLIERQQVELVGTAWHEPILSAIPERDGAAQIVTHVTLLKKVFGVRPTGCWLPYGVWDPSVPRIMVKAGIEWTLVEDRFLVEVGSASGGVYGVYRTEREGFSLALFPVDTQMRDMAANVPVKDIFVHFRRRGQREHRLVTVALSAATFGLRPGRDPRVDQTWFATMLAGMVKPNSPVQTVLPTEALRRGPHRGRVYLPSCAPRKIGVPWERFLARYDEANRLHKKMLRVSRTTHKLERAVKEGSVTGERPDPSMLLQAHRYLHRAQTADAYWHGDHAGIYDPVIRNRAWKDLLRAECVALDALGTRLRLVVETIDLDGDGVNEVSMRTPTATVIVDPARGGGITEFSIYKTSQNLVNTMTRIPESYHSDPAEAGNLGDVEHSVTEETAGGPKGRYISPKKPRFGRDLRPRVCFVEHMLGPEVTLASMKSGAFREGTRNSLDETWELVSAERHADEALSTILSVESWVAEKGGERRIRLTKRYVLDANGVLTMRLEVVNRSHEALRTRLAIELNLTLGPDPKQQSLVIRGQTLATTDENDMEKVDRMRIEGPLASLDIEVQPAARLWHFPVETLHKHQLQQCLVVQGVCLVFQWPIELWGKGKDRVYITLTTVD